MQRGFKADSDSPPHPRASYHPLKTPPLNSGKSYPLGSIQWHPTSSLSVAGLPECSFPAPQSSIPQAPRAAQSWWGVPLLSPLRAVAPRFFTCIRPVGCRWSRVDSDGCRLPVSADLRGGERMTPPRPLATRSCETELFLTAARIGGAESRLLSSHGSRGRPRLPVGPSQEPPLLSASAQLG